MCKNKKNIIKKNILVNSLNKRYGRGFQPKQIFANHPNVKISLIWIRYERVRPIWKIQNGDIFLEYSNAIRDDKKILKSTRESRK